MSLKFRNINHFLLNKNLQIYSYRVLILLLRPSVISQNPIEGNKSSPGLGKPLYMSCPYANVLLSRVQYNQFTP